MIRTIQKNEDEILKKSTKMIFGGVLLALTSLGLLVYVVSMKVLSWPE